MALKMHPDLTVHVGEFLKSEVVAPTVTALAAHFGVSRQTLSSLLNGSAGLSPDMAIRFEKAWHQGRHVAAYADRLRSCASAQARAGHRGTIADQRCGVGWPICRPMGPQTHCAKSAPRHETMEVSKYPQ